VQGNARIFVTARSRKVPRTRCDGDRQQEIVMDFAIDNQVNRYARISEVAKRLGVEPFKGSGGVLMTGADGQNYDVFEVVIALLDRIDAATAIRDNV